MARWIHRVTTDVLHFPRGLFTLPAKQIARGLHRASMRSARPADRKFQSAMSMLVFYINRAGRNLAPADRRRLENAKVELRKLFDR